MHEGHWHEGDDRDFEFDRADEGTRGAEMRPSLSVSKPRRSGATNGADPFRKQSGRKHCGGMGIVSLDPSR
jgi:hypothetical protein